MNKDINFVALPPGITPAAIASLTEQRQKVLLTLLLKGKPLSLIAKEIPGVEASSVYKSLQKLEEEGFLVKTANKFYELTANGKLLSLMVAKPNGKSEEWIRESMDHVLKDDFGLTKDDRDGLIELTRELGGLFPKEN